MDESTDTAGLLNRASSGDSGALGELLEQHRERLTRVISFRMDDRLRGRIDPSDVVQEAFLSATTRFPEYLDDRKMLFFCVASFHHGSEAVRTASTSSRDKGS